MKMRGEPDPLYVAARSVLLDALEALGHQRDAIVLVGAQAIYLHTGAIEFEVAEYTTRRGRVHRPAVAHRVSRARVSPHVRCEPNSNRTLDVANLGERPCEMCARSWSLNPFTSSCAGDDGEFEPGDPSYELTASPA